MRGEERRGEGGGGVGGLFEWNISSIFKLPASPKLFGMACPLLFLLFLKWKIYSQEFYLEDWTWEDLLVWALCQLTWILPAPPPSPPPPHPLHLVLMNSFFHEKSLLSNFDPPLPHSYRQTLTSNPELLNFTPAMPTIFANTANPVFIPVSIFHQTMVQELRGAGGQMRKGTNLSLTRTHTDIAPPNPYASWPITLLQKIHSRCWRSPPAKKKYTAPPHSGKRKSGKNRLSWKIKIKLTLVNC